MAVDSGKTIVMAALGRPFSLGMLYDCRNDSLIPALTLWDREALEKDAAETAQPNSDFEIVASDSIEDKSSALNVDASLKASFLCGLVDLDGSAKFLSDSKMSRNQARVTLKYKSTTKFKHLSMNHIGRGNVEHPYVFESGQATHVVTGILYGAQAFFVFDRELSEKEDLQDIEGNLKVLIKKIPTLKIDGQGALTMGDKDIANVDKFSCKFHGDFNLDKHPVSFQEAIEVYQSLPKLIGTNGENAVPQKVWLMPLKTLDSAAAQLVRQISDRLIRDAQNILEDLSELERRCNDAKKCNTTHQFPQITKKVKDFKGQVSQYKLEFQKIMAAKLPLIRGGGEEEGVLAKILKNVHSSPFNPNDLNEWMDSKETEIKIISSLIDKMPNMTIVGSRSTLPQVMLSGDVRHTVCLVFSSLETPEPYLLALANYLERTEPDNEPGAHYDVQKEQWFLSNKTMEEVQEKVKLFKDFAEANKENKTIRFLTTVISDDEMKGATLHLYKKVSLVCNNFQPPSNPEMTTADTSHNSVTLRISPPPFGSTSVTHYTVEFCVHGDDVWYEQKESKAGEVTVSGLRLNEAYRFRCRAVCPVGLGPACEESSVKTLPSSAPEKLQVECNSTELSVRWEKPSELGPGVQIEHYILEYAEKSPEMKPEECLWSKLTIPASDSPVTVIPGLRPSTQYTLRVRCDCGQAGLGNEKSIVVCTDTQDSVRLAEVIRASSKQIESGPPSVFKLPLEINNIGIDGCKSYTFGKHSVRRNRTVMFVGATGAGKSTLINGMINHILGIDWKDSFRFKLIDEGQLKSQSESQTSHVTAYKVNHQDGFKVPYSLTFVDTPGFGDTRGIEKDRMITEQIRRLFTSGKGVFEIDAICFVTQASLARLTPTQKYVFDSVLSIFGKDVADNICMLVTFADGQQPPVLEAINFSKVPCPKTDIGLPLHHKFNNSALFADNRSVLDRPNEDSDEDMEVDNFDAMFWAMGAKSMKTFFTALDKMTTQSLQLTKEVLNERKQLEAAVEGLQPQVRVGLSKLEELRSTQQQIEKHNADIMSNENYQIEVEILKPVKEMLTKKGEYITNCQQCSVTCHYPCAIADDAEKSGCSAMRNGTCMVCPGKCAWNIHFNQKYRWDYVQEKQMKTVQELKEKYENATQAKITVQQLIENQEEEIANLQDVVMSLMDTSSGCLARLNEIALRPNPLSTPEYIDLLIEGERSEAKAGYLARIQSLETMKGKAQIIAKVLRREKLTRTEEEFFVERQKRQEKKGKLAKFMNWLGF